MSETYHAFPGNGYCFVVDQRHLSLQLPEAGIPEGSIRSVMAAGIEPSDGSVGDRYGRGRDN